jgi:aspartyl protease family protein
MDSDQTARLIAALLCMTLVASSLFSRQLPMGQVFRMILAWAGIFAGVFALFLFLPEMKQIWARAKAEVSGGVEQKDGTLQVRKSDEHFYIDASVNGTSIRFMIDSGATTTTMSADAAKSAGVDVDMEGFPVIVSTANGMAESRRGRVRQLTVGPITREDFPVHVSETLGDTNLLGMNFLSSLKGWKIEGETLILNP